MARGAARLSRRDDFLPRGKQHVLQPVGKGAQRPGRQVLKGANFFDDLGVEMVRDLELNVVGELGGDGLDVDAPRLRQRDGTR